MKSTQIGHGRQHSIEYLLQDQLNLTFFSNSSPSPIKAKRKPHQSLFTFQDTYKGNNLPDEQTVIKYLKSQRTGLKKNRKFYQGPFSLNRTGAIPHSTNLHIRNQLGVTGGYLGNQQSMIFVMECQDSQIKNMKNTSKIEGI